ncbi:TPA: Myotubularin-like phosphatase domain [Trebouxia sp. C0004]
MGNHNSALLEAASVGDLRTAKQLLDKPGAIDVNWMGQDKWAALHYAACNGHLALTGLLIDHGANVNATEEAKRTALHLAARNGHTEVVADLLKAGADVNATDHDDMTALHRAAANGNTRAAGELIWAHAYVDAKLQDGATALHLAAWHGHTSTVQLLLQKSADANAADDEGCTPLHRAAAAGHANVVKQLLQKNADAHATDKVGKTAAALAQDHGHANVAALLTTCTHRPSTNRTPSSLQTSMTPSASPLPSLHSASPLHNLPSQTQPPMHQSPSSQQQSVCAPAACSAAATSSSSGTPHAVSYPSIFGAAPAQGHLRPHHIGQLVSECAPVSQSHAPSAEEERILGWSGSDGGHTEAVPADVPALGYVPGALSSIRNKLQAVLPEMLRAGTASLTAAEEGSDQMQAVQPNTQQQRQQQQQQQTRQHSGPYGLLDEQDEDNSTMNDSAAPALAQQQESPPQQQARQRSGPYGLPHDQGRSSTAMEDSATSTAPQQAGELVQQLAGMQLQDPTSFAGAPDNQQPGCQLFRYGEVSAMCNGFNSRSLLRYSTLVSQGRLHNQPVAVRLHPSARHQSPAVLQHWLDGLSQLSHPHVLSILGACLEPAAIITPLMQNGSLDGALRGQPTSQGRPPPSLQWHQRIRLAAACADALSYLHSHVPQPWLHQQLHPANILLDSNLLPQLSGIAIPADSSRATVDTDVYALGMIMLQLLTGREAQAALIHDVQAQLHRDTLSDLTDPCAGCWPLKQAEQFASLALRCTDERPHLGEDILPQLRTLAAWAQQIDEPPSWYECPITSVSCLPQSLTDASLSSLWLCVGHLLLTQVARDHGSWIGLAVVHDVQHEKEDLCPTSALTICVATS